MYKKVKIESTLTIWSQSGEKPVADSNRSVIICSHGGQSGKYKLMTVPPEISSVNFYCPDGYKYTGMLGNIADRSYEIYETISGGQQCRNYDLSYDKMTTPELIEGTFLSPKDIAANMKVQGFSQEQVDEFLGNAKPVDMDIVTLRTSRIFKEPTLEKVIDMLWRNGWKYNEFHCAHCRYAGESGVGHDYKPPLK